MILWVLKTPSSFVDFFFFKYPFHKEGTKSTLNEWGLALILILMLNKHSDSYGKLNVQEIEGTAMTIPISEEEDVYIYICLPTEKQSWANRLFSMEGGAPPPAPQGMLWLPPVRDKSIAVFRA